jgi:hypothetical protein
MAYLRMQAHIPLALIAVLSRCEESATNPKERRGHRYASRFRGGGAGAQVVAIPFARALNYYFCCGPPVQDSTGSYAARWMGSLKRNYTLINALLRLATPDRLRIPQSIRLSARNIFRSRHIVKTELRGSSHHFPLDRVHGYRSLLSAAAWIGPQVLSPSFWNDTASGSTASVERAPPIVCESG